MALDYATNDAERAAVALIAGPGARLTGRFGARPRVPGTTSRPFHPGIDIAGRLVGDKVALLAPRSFAKVWYSSKDAAGALDLFLGDKTDGLRYVHNSRNVQTKGTIARGSTVAYMGMTGNVNGVHVHLERYEGGQPVDPLPWLIRLAGVKPSNPTNPATPTAPPIIEGRESMYRRIRIADGAEKGNVYLVNVATGKRLHVNTLQLTLADDADEAATGRRPEVEDMSANEAYRYFELATLLV